MLCSAKIPFPVRIILGGGHCGGEMQSVLCLYRQSVGWDSAVGIAIRYGLDGPGSESRWGRDFQHPSGPALGPT